MPNLKDGAGEDRTPSQDGEGGNGAGGKEAGTGKDRESAELGVGQASGTGVCSVNRRREDASLDRDQRHQVGTGLREPDRPGGQDGTCSHLQACPGRGCHCVGWGVEGC